MNKTTRLKKPQIPELDTLYTFDDLGGRPKYGGEEMTSETDIPSFQEIMDETHSAVVAEATARDDADEELEAQIIANQAEAAEAIATEAEARAAADTALSTALNTEASTRGAADNVLQSQIDAIVASSDVKDIVGTKAELDAYDTSTLGENDIIKVLADETQNNATTYYRWASSTFTLIGSEGPYYTKGQADALLNDKADKATTYTKTEVDATVADLESDIAAKQDQLTAGDNITIANNVISAQAGVKEILTTDSDFYTHISMFMANHGAGVYKITNPTSARVTLSPSNTTGTGQANLTLYINPNSSVIYAFGKEYSGGEPCLVLGAYNTSGNSGNFIVHPGVENGITRLDYVTQNSFTAYASSWGTTIPDFRLVKQLKDMIGDLTNLSTTDKTNLVAAINELASSSNDWTTLTTADYNAVQHSAIAISYLTPGKYHVTLDESVMGVAQDTPGANEEEIQGDTIIVLPYDKYENRIVLHYRFEMYEGSLLRIYHYQYDALQDIINVGNTPNIVHGPGISYTDVMSQNAVTSMVFADPSARRKVQIGNGSNAVGTDSVAIGYGARTDNTNGLSLGTGSRATGAYGIALGGAQAAGVGVMSIGLGNYGNVGYNNSNYRLLTGLYDPQTDHDAATKGYVDTAIASAGGAEEINSTDWSNLWQ